MTYDQFDASLLLLGATTDDPGIYWAISTPAIPEGAMLWHSSNQMAVHCTTKHSAAVLGLVEYTQYTYARALEQIVNALGRGGHDQ